MYRDNRAFTLIEVVIAGVIMMLVIGAVHFLMLAGNTIWHRGEAQVDLQQNVRVAVTHMTSVVRQASAVAKESDEEKLILIEPGGRKVKFYLADDVLRKAYRESGDQEFSGHNPIAYSLFFLEFSYMGEYRQVVRIKVEGKDEKGQKFYLETKARLRSEQGNYIFGS